MAAPIVEEIDNFRRNVRVTLSSSLCDHLGILESNIMAISKYTRKVFSTLPWWLMKDVLPVQLILPTVHTPPLL